MRSITIWKPRRGNENHVPLDAKRHKILDLWIAEHGHPRGALGMKHSAATRIRLGELSKAHWDSMSDDDKRAQVLRMLTTKEANGAYAPPRTGVSWKASWREIGGLRSFYRSRWEANYARYLEWMKGLGEIMDWKHEPRVFWFKGLKRGSMSYLPDFWVKDKDGSESYHEVKGWMDKRSKTKIARMRKYYPDVRLMVIDSKHYRVLAGQMMGLVPEWE